MALIGAREATRNGCRTGLLQAFYLSFKPALDGLSTSVWCANIGLNCLYLPLSAQRELLNHSQSGYCPTMVH